MSLGGRGVMRADDRTADCRGLADVILGFDRSYSNDTYLSGLRVLSGTDYNLVTQLRCDGVVEVCAGAVLPSRKTSSDWRGSSAAQPQLSHRPPPSRTDVRKRHQARSWFKNTPKVLFQHHAIYHQLCEFRRKKRLRSKV